MPAITLGRRDLLVSGSVDAFEGARAMVLDAEDLFRLDVVVVPDSVRIVVRNHTDGPMTFAPDGYPRPVIASDPERLVELAVRPAHHQVAATIDGADVKIVLGMLRHLDRGMVQVTGQAIVRGPA